MDRDLHRTRQRGNVELEVGVLGKAIPRTTDVPEGVHGIDLVEGRVPDPEERAALRAGQGEAHAPHLIWIVGEMEVLNLSAPSFLQI